MLKLYKVHRVVILFLLLKLTDTSFAYDGYYSSLPTPRGLESSVKFWERIFRVYSPDKSIVHDNFDLSIVYAIWKIDGSSSREINRSMKNHILKVRKVLEYLASGKIAKTKLQKQVFNAFPRGKRKNIFFKIASKRVRAQRGVSLKRSMKRSAKYLSKIRDVFKEENIPRDLAYLPHLESGFNRFARSKAGAVGLWQLMPSTAKRAMQVHGKNDQRKDVKISTKFAAKYLKKLYKNTKSWPLAITGYNYGPNGIRRAIKKYGRNYIKIRNKHKTRLFRFAVRNYYPSFLAIRNLVEKNPVPFEDRAEYLNDIADRSTYPKKFFF